MKKLTCFLFAASVIASSASGCSYGMIATAGNDKVVITRQDGFLFGILRKVFVCKVTDGGATACAEGTSP
jgi:hypothetical protein